MDILLDANGDIKLDKKDICFSNSIVQKIKIHLQWFLREWKWNEEIGMPYFEEFFVKNPNISLLKMRIREEIFKIKEITEISSIEIILSRKEREVKILFIVRVEEETIKGEVSIIV